MKSKKKFKTKNQYEKCDEGTKHVFITFFILLSYFSDPKLLIFFKFQIYF